MASEVQELSHVLKELAEIKTLLSVVIEQKTGEKAPLPPADKEFLTVDEAAAFIGAKKSYIYHLTHQKLIPFSKPGGNHVLIKKSDLLDWVEANRIKSQGEIQKEVAELVAGSRRRAGRGRRRLS